MPEIVALQEHQRKQAETFLRSDRLRSRLAMGMLPFLVNSGLLRWLMGKRLRSLQHGVVPVRLTVWLARSLTHGNSNVRLNFAVRQLT